MVPALLALIFPLVASVPDSTTIRIAFGKYAPETKLAGFDSLTGRLTSERPIPFDWIGFHRDTLVGSQVLVPQGKGIWRLPDGAVVRLGERRRWIPRDLVVLGDRLCHRGLVGTEFSSGPILDSVCFDEELRPVAGRFGSEWIEPASRFGIERIHDSGSRYRWEVQMGPVHRVRLMPRDTTIWSRLNWLDSLGRPLTRPLEVVLDDSGFTPVRPVRFDWIDAGVSLRPERAPRYLWAVRHGTTDTLRARPGREGLPLDSCPASWRARNPAMSDSVWTFLDSSLGFFQAWGHHGWGRVYIGPDIHPARWQAHGFVWAPIPMDGFPGWKSPATSPKAWGSNDMWRLSPAPLDSTERIPVKGLGQARTSGLFRFRRGDSLWAVVRIQLDSAAKRRFQRDTFAGEILTRSFPRAGRPDSVVLVPDSFRLSRLDVDRYPTGFDLEFPSGAIDLVSSPRGLEFAEVTDPRIDGLDRERERRHYSGDFDRGRPFARCWGTSAPISHLTAFPEASPVPDTGRARLLRARGGTAFAVDEVPPDSSPRRNVPLRTWRSEFAKGIVDSAGWIAGNPGTGNLVRGAEGLHPFVAAFVMASDEHRPVRLSPEAVWMVLLENVAARLSKQPEECRTDLVDHLDLKDLIVHADPGIEDRFGEDSTWYAISRRLVAEIPGSGRRRGLLDIPTFSTTTPTRALAMRLRVLARGSMDSPNKDRSSCGIPWVVLEGTPVDWKKIRAKARSLEICGLGPWVRELDPVLREFEAASRGRASLPFWKSFVRFVPATESCGSKRDIDGWITTLFGVDKGGRIRSMPYRTELESFRGSRGEFQYLHRSKSNQIRHFTVVSGFSGVGQDPTDGSLYPELGWGVWETKGITDSQP